jgi:hypothetical protein
MGTENGSAERRRGPLARQVYAQLGHHNMFLASGEYRKSFSRIFDDNTLPDEPSFYVTTPYPPPHRVSGSGRSENCVWATGKVLCTGSLHEMFCGPRVTFAGARIVRRSTARRVPTRLWPPLAGIDEGHTAILRCLMLLLQGSFICTSMG